MNKRAKSFEVGQTINGKRVNAVRRFQGPSELHLEDKSIINLDALSDTEYAKLVDQAKAQEPQSFSIQYDVLDRDLEGVIALIRNIAASRAKKEK